jgi:hypothetical protein
MHPANVKLAKQYNSDEDTRDLLDRDAQLGVGC